MWMLLEAIFSEFSPNTVLLATDCLCVSETAFCSNFTVHFHPLGEGLFFWFVSDLCVCCLIVVFFKAVYWLLFISIYT